MALTNSQPNNINVPSGNGLVVYIDNETNEVYVRDIRGATEELNVLTNSITQVDVTGGLTVLRSGNTITLGTDSEIIQLKAEKGQPNGYASLDSSGKLPVSELPVSVLTYEGLWNAATNTPFIYDGTGDAGDFYIVSVAGTQDLGSGPIRFEVGDWVIYSGTVWQANSSEIPDLQEVTDVGAVTTNAITTGGITTDYVQLDLTATPTLTVGMARWNSDQLTWEVGIGTGPTAYELGQSLYYPQVRNVSGTNLPKGTLVMVNPADVSTGDRLNVIRAVADGSYPTQLFVGILAEAITSGQTGFAIWFGQVYNASQSAINLGGETWAEGNILYADPAHPGGLTNVEPSAPNHKVTIAAIQSVNGNNVNLLVRPWLNEDIGQLNDVSISSPVDNSILQFNSTTGAWENVAGTTTNIAEGTNLYFTTARARESVSAGDGISYDSGTGVITNSDRGSSQDIFKNIAVATQSTITADSNNDTLTFAAGTNIGITTNATSDTITISTVGVPTGTGVANYVALWTSASNLSTSLIYDNGISIGVGTTTPQAIFTTNVTDSSFNFEARRTTIINNGTTVGAIGFRGSVGGLVATAASIYGEAENTWDIGAGTISSGLAINVVSSGAQTQRFKLLSTGKIVASGYGAGTFTGTPAYNLFVDASGNIIEGPGGVIDGGGTANYIPLWTDSNTIADSIMYETSSKIGINTTTPGGTLHVYAANSGASSQYSGTLIVESAGPATIQLLSVNTQSQALNFGDAESGNIGRVEYSHLVDELRLYTNNTSKLEVTSTGTIQLTSYGGGTKSGTAAYNLAVDASGNIIETAGAVIDGSGTTNYVSKFTDSNTIADSIIYDTGSAVGIGTTTPASALQVVGTITASTFSGDLNGTINTATTGFTQANSDNSTKVATTAFVQNLLATVPAGLSFQGTWNAATNTPTLTSSVGTPGYFYIVSVEGNTNLNGITDWKVGDWAVFVEAGGTDTWQKVDNTSVLDGAGTGGYIAQWAGSGTSVTLEDSVIYDTGTNIGIGTVTPQGKLDVDGAIISTSSRINAGGDGILFSIRTNYSGNAAIVEAGQTSSDGYLNVKDATGTIYTSLSGYSGTPSYFLTNVGVGTNTPFNTYSGISVLGTDPSLAIKTTNAGGWTWLQFVNSAGTNNFSAGVNQSIPYFGIKAGAGMDSPDFKLSTNGAIQFAQYGSGTFTGTAAYALAVDASGNIIEASGGGIVDGSGTTNYVAKWSDSNTIGNSLIYDNGTNVGIGTTSPNRLLTIKNSSDGVNGLSFQSYASTSELGYIRYEQTNDILDIVNTSSFASGGIKFSTSNTERLRITSAGNVGIGTTSPSYKLQVEGAGRFSNGALGTLIVKHNYSFHQPNWGIKLDGDSGSSGGYLSQYIDIGGFELAQGGTYYGGGPWLADSNSTTYSAVVGNGGVLIFSTASGLTPGGTFVPSERMRITSGGNVLIGTSTDNGFKLNVNGTGYFGDNIKIEGNYPSLTLAANSGTTFYIQSSYTNSVLDFGVNGVGVRMNLNNNGQLQLNNYGSGSFSGTVAYNLAVDSSGKIIETTGGVVDGSGTANYVAKWSDSNTVGNSIIYDNGTGVGIGTTGPSTLLHLEKSSASNDITGTPSIIISNRNSTSGTFVGGGIFNNPYRDVSTSSVTAGVWFENQNSPDAGAAAKASALVFGANSYSTGWALPTERMRITQGGLVGVGTANPLSKFDVSLESGQALFIANESGTISDGDLLGAVSFGSRDGSTYSSGGITNIRSYATATYNTGNVSGDMRFYVSSSLQNTTQAALFGTEAMRIASSGNLLIGTTTDSGYKLDVNGTAYIRNVTRVQATNTFPLRLIAQGGPVCRISFEDPDNASNDGVWVGSQGFALCFGSSFSEQARISSAGNFLIGTTTDSGYKLDVNGNVYVNGTITEASARHLKENIKPLESTLDKINALEPVTYNLIGSDKNEIGLIAEDVAELFPQVVEYNAEGAPSGVNYTRLSVILIKALQEMSETLNKLQTK